MDAKDFYSAIGEDYNYIFTFLRNDERISKYIKMFYSDETYNELEKALEAKDYETSFRMVHTLKGVALNLGFKSLSMKASDLTELLRHKKNEDITEDYLKVVLESFKSVSECYLLIRKNLEKFMEE